MYVCIHIYVYVYIYIYIEREIEIEREREMYVHINVIHLHITYSIIYKDITPHGRLSRRPSGELRSEKGEVQGELLV